MNTDHIEKKAEMTEIADDQTTTTQVAVIEKKKGSGFRSFMTKAGDASMKVLATVQEKAQDLSEQQQIKNYEARMRKYNPLFEDEYNSANFKLSNVIIITDAFTRKNKDVYEGAIAYRTIDEDEDVEILHLFDDELSKFDIEFVPNAMCNSVYFVDPHDSHRYINIDMFFSITHEEKLAELQHIAYSLGASRYWVEIVDVELESQTSKAKIGAGLKGRGNVEATSETVNSSKRSTKAAAEAVFTGKRKPVEPTLCWYIHDRNVQNLIKMRCSGKNKDDITNYTIELNSAVSASMSRNTAMKVQAAIVNLDIKCDLNAKSEQEHSRKMYFKLEF